MPESSEVKGVCCSSVECGTPPRGAYTQSPLPLHRNSYLLSPFCTEHNVQECLSHISQEVSSLGLPPVWTQSAGGSEMNIVAVLNSMYDLIQMNHRNQRTVENMEVEQLKSNSNMDFLQLTTKRLKEQLELSKRENTAVLERERQLQLKLKSVQNCLKNEKEEVQKLQNIIASRASQYNHDTKRKEREFNKLKERLNQLLADKKEKKPAIEVLNNIGKASGKRSLWKTEKTEAKREEEMYKTLLIDYDSRQRELMQENSELRKVLQQMKKDIASLLRSRNRSVKRNEDEQDGKEVASEEDEVFDSSKDSVDLNCLDAREKLTNSIRQQWRKLKSHVERLDSEASSADIDGSQKGDAAPQESPEDEMNRLKLEIKHYKCFIQAQQQLLQQQLSSQFDEETTSKQIISYMPQDKERLNDEWKTLEKQRKIFEKERGNLTEAAIRLSQERKVFEEDRATWLKQEFLSLSPFVNDIEPPLSKSSTCAVLASEEDESAELVTENLIECKSDMAPPPVRATTSPSVSELCHTTSFISENSPEKSPNESEPEADTDSLCESVLQLYESEDLSSCFWTNETNSPT